MATIVKDINILRLVSSMVTESEAKDIIKELEFTLSQHDDGIGLSAIQIGIPKRIFILRDKGDPNKFNHFINPHCIEKESEFVFFKEGCLSFPGMFLNTNRYHHYTIKNHILDGDNFREETNYFYYPEHNDEYVIKSRAIQSIAVQHEMDHLDGKILPEYGFSPYSLRRETEKIGRNEPCPCGKENDSGKPIKYKKCCGKG